MRGRAQPASHTALIGALTLALTVMLTVAAAKADLAAGRAAFNRGDFDVAEAEWRPLAESGDAEAELGLGEVYEQGRDDYLQAERWYAKAAEQGSIRARYRLALIAIAGNKAVPPDPVKAYKWAILGTAPNSEWGDLAADLQRLLKERISAGEQAEGRKQAELWEEQHGLRPKPVEQSGLAPPVAPLMPAPIAPALPVAPRGPIDCTLPGHPGPQPPCSPNEIPPAIPGRTAVLPAPQIASPQAPRAAPPNAGAREDPAEVLRRIAAAKGLEARLADGVSVLHEGDPIRIEVKAGNYPVNVRVDYFALDGQVLHMLPNDDRPAVVLTAGSKRVFGSGEPGDTWNAGGPPFGTEFITVLGTPQALDLGKRPMTEAAADYLNALEGALRRLRPNSQQPNLLATVPVNIAAR